MLFLPNTVTNFSMLEREGDILLYDEVLRSLRAATDKIVAIPDEEWAFLLSKYEYLTFPKGAFLAKPGEMADQAHTILRGIVQDHDGD
jgi:hypothetical protein